MISLAIHTGNSDLLESTADSLADKILWPLAEGYDETVPTPIRVLVYHVQWITQLCAFLSMGIGTVNQDEEFEIVIALAGRGFPGPDHATMAPWIASFLRRVRGNGEMTAVRIETRTRDGDLRFAREGQPLDACLRPFKSLSFPVSS